MPGMTTSTGTELAVAPLGRRRAWVAAAVIGVLDVVLVAVLMVFDKVDVRTPGQLGHVASGWPLNWVVQDQGIEPPLPYRTGFVSPWESSTTIDWLPLVLDLVIVGLVMTTLWRGVLAVSSQPFSR